MKKKNEIEKVFDKTLAYLLKKHREEINKSQEMIAIAAGINRVTLGKWEKGDKTPNFFDLYNTLKFLKISLSDFCSELEKIYEEEITPIKIAAEKVKINAYFEQARKRRDKKS